MGLKFFVSDCHFGAVGNNDSEVSAILEEFCSKNLTRGDELYILGDFFDFWIEYGNFVPSNFVPIYNILLNQKARGIKITLVCGNHDFMCGSFFENLGFCLFNNEIKFEHNGKKILCIHGDGISGSFAYSIIKSVLKNRFFQFLYKCLPSDFALFFMETVSNLSRKKNISKVLSEKRKERYRKYAVDFAAKKNCDILIMGHSHIADLFESNGKIIANCGAWFEKPTFIVLDGNKILLKEFHGGREKDIILCEKGALC